MAFLLSRLALKSLAVGCCETKVDVINALYVLLCVVLVTVLVDVARLLIKGLFD